MRTWVLPPIEELDNYLLMRVLVVGGPGTGKSSIVKRFTEKKWFDTPHEEGIEYRTCYRFYNGEKDLLKFLLVDVPR
jgi:GTPase SAR1 family protein